MRGTLPAMCVEVRLSNRRGGMAIGQPALGKQRWEGLMGEEPGNRSDEATPATYGWSAFLAPMCTAAILALMITVWLWQSLAEYGNNTDRLCVVPMLWGVAAPISAAAGGGVVGLSRRKNESAFVDIVIGILVPGVMLLVLWGLLAR